MIATNTSSLPIAGLAESVDTAGALPRRALVQPAGVDARHRGDQRPGDGAGRGRARLELLREVGKQPAEVADRAGFVSNRLQMALLREALAIVAEGQTTREDLDTIVRSTFGFRLPFYGPFQIADMAGLDTYVGVYKTLERDVGPEFAPPDELREHVEAGRLGTKAGEGFSTYSDEERDQPAARARPPVRRAWRGCSRKIDAPA